MGDDMEDLGDWVDISVVCPKCGSSEVAVAKDEFGYFRVIICPNCGYQKNNVPTTSLGGGL